MSAFRAEAELPRKEESRHDNIILAAFRLTLYFEIWPFH